MEKYVDSNTKIVFGSTTREDRATTEEFFIKYNFGNSCLLFPNTVEEYWTQLNNIDYIISGRMHAMILAMQKGCICIPYEWRDKLKVYKQEYCDVNLELSEIRDKVKIGFAELRRRIKDEKTP